MTHRQREMLGRVFQRLLKVLDIVFIILDIAKKIKATYELIIIAKVALTHLISLFF